MHVLYDTEIDFELSGNMADKACFSCELGNKPWISSNEFYVSLQCHSNGLFVVVCLVILFLCTQFDFIGI